MVKKKEMVICEISIILILICRKTRVGRAQTTKNKVTFALYCLFKYFRLDF